MSYLDSLFSMKDKVAVVTGAARGNGKSISIALARAGASVILIDVLQKELKSTAEEINSFGCNAVFYICDLSDDKQIKHTLKSIAENYDRVDVLVNNAGVTYGHHAIDYPEEFWNKTYQVNLRAPYILSIGISKLMKKFGGSIINITSLGAELSFPDNIAYVAFKGGLKQFTKALAHDLSEFNIRANNVGPGYIKTNMTEGSWNDPELNQLRKDRTLLGRWGMSSDLEGVIIFLASNASSYITAQDIYVDGGWTAKGL
jgi:NAD(P)-dependent dehydrogenase (short-subunit alcohol dehydrogenase family)